MLLTVSCHRVPLLAGCLVTSPSTQGAFQDTLWHLMLMLRKLMTFSRGNGDISIGNSAEQTQQCSWLKICPLPQGQWLIIKQIKNN